MKSIVDGKKYDTETSDQICKLASVSDEVSFAWHETHLYRTKRGAFFIAGRGHACSIWSRHSGPGRTSGSGVKPVSDADARKYMEYAGCDEDDFIAVGLSVEEA